MSTRSTRLVKTGTSNNTKKGKGKAQRKLQPVEHAPASARKAHRPKTSDDVQWVKGYKITLAGGLSIYPENPKKKVTYKVGGRYVMTHTKSRPIEMCARGFHFSPTALQCLLNVDPDDMRTVELWRVKAPALVVQWDSLRTKCVASKLIMEEKIPTNERNQHLTGWADHGITRLFFWKGLTLAQAGRSDGDDEKFRLYTADEFPVCEVRSLEGKGTEERFRSAERLVGGYVRKLEKAFKDTPEGFTPPSLRGMGDFYWSFARKGHTFYYMPPLDDAHENLVCVTRGLTIHAANFDAAFALAGEWVDMIRNKHKQN